MGAQSLFMPGHSLQPPQRLAKQFLEAYNEMPWLRAVVNRIATSVAQIEWKVFTTRSQGTRRRVFGASQSTHLRRQKLMTELKQQGELVEIHDHPVLDLLETGNKYFMGMSTRQLIQIYLEILGEAFLIKVRDARGQIVELWPVPPIWIESTPSPARPFFQVNFPSWHGPIPMEEMIWMQHPNPAQPYGRGVGMMRALSDELEIDDYAAKFTKSFFYNHAKPDMIITMEGADKDERERAEKHWNERLAGMFNAMRPYFTNQKMQIDTLTQDYDHLKLTELRESQRNTIIQVTGLPPEIFGILENSNRATIEAADFLYSRWAIEPRAEFQRIVWQEELVTEFDDRLILDFVSPVQEDKEFNLKAAQAAPWSLTVDEWREIQGKPPKDDGSGNVHMVPFNLTPTTNINEPVGLLGGARSSVPPQQLRSHEPPVIIINPQDYIDRSYDHEHVCLDPATHDCSDPWLRAAHDLISPYCFSALDNPSPVSIFYRQGPPTESGPLGDLFLAMHDVADRFKNDVRDLFIGSVEEVRRNIDRARLQSAVGQRNGPLIERTIPIETLNTLTDFMADSNLSQIALAGSVSANIFEAVTGFQLDFDPRSQGVITLAQTQAADLVTGIVDAQVNDVRRAIQTILEGDRSIDASAQLIGDIVGLTERQAATLLRFEQNLRDQGIDEAQLRDRVSRMGNAMRKRRGEMIGRTETITIANGGQHEAWRQGANRGLIDRRTAQRVWITTDDDRTCPICEPMDGQVVGLEEAFVTPQGRSVMYPTAHPQCRCAVALRVNALDAILTPPFASAVGA